MRHESRVGVAARHTGRRWAAVALAVAVLAGCTQPQEEPGLFGRRTPSPEEQVGGVAVTNPDLPVIGDDTWTTGDGSYVDVRIAIHAVRRVQGATVLDWSITPLRGLNLLPGDPVPSSVDLGLSRFGEGGTNIFLIDTFSHRLYRPLTHRSGGRYRDTGPLQHCLCTPLWLAKRSLHVGETRLLQMVFPELPSAQHTIDVDVATVPIFAHLPITPEDKIPVKTNSTDLTRAADHRPVLAGTGPFRYPDHDQQFEILLNRVVSSDTSSSVEWTIQSLSEGDGLEQADQPPIARELPRSSSTGAQGRAYNAVSASGPAVTTTDPPLTALQATTRLQAGSTLECLCSDLRHWASALRSPNQQVRVVTNLPALPRFTSAVGINFPGLPTLQGIPVIRAIDGSIRVGVPVAHKGKTWSYDATSPGRGWLPGAWPTPLPGASQLDAYTATVDDLR